MIALLISILFLANGGERNTELDSYLKAELSEYKKYEYEVVSLPSYVNTINDSRISISNDRDFRINYGYAYVPVDIEVSPNNISQSVITIKVNLFDQVLVANRRIRRGEIVSPADFSVQEEDITHLKNKAVKDLLTIENQQAAINISEGAILQENMVESQPDIKAGDKVFAYSSLGSVIVSFPVSVRENGRIGEKIRVARDDGLIFKALVVGTNKVKIVE